MWSSREHRIQHKPAVPFGTFFGAQSPRYTLPSPTCMRVIGIVGLSLTESGPLNAWSVAHETVSARAGFGKVLGNHQDWPRPSAIESSCFPADP